MMPSSLARPAPEAVDAVQAGLAVERLINTWLRERSPDLVPPEGETCTIPLGDATLLAPCRHASPGGFHAWGPCRLRLPDGRVVDLDGPADLARRMIDAAVPEATPVREAMKRRLLDGLRRSRDHARACAARPFEPTPTGLEQGLWHGHPFHPLAKSVDGFSETDSDLYAPERAASFRLRWLVADPALAATLWREPEAEAWIGAALARLSGLSRETMAGRVVIPSHPWQAARLEADPAIRALVAQGRLAITPPSGTPVTPTSSVRTVFSATENLFLKLPIAARITNFARTNSREHLARSLSAARALAALPETVAACGLDILGEPGALALADPAFEAVTGVLVREGPAGPALVVAGLLEPSPRDGRPVLAAIGASLATAEDAAAWLRAYAGAAILPPLRLFARTGISLEAHAQNSLLVLDGGLPSRLVVRDLEGASIDGARFRRRVPDLALDPAVLYGAEEAWRRLLYYLVVNQVAHVVATVARAADLAEAPLWQVVAHSLAACDEDAATTALIERLLAAPTLPAKANLASCLAGRGERPDYVALANPLRAARAQSEAQAWHEAGTRVTGQLLGALLHEDLLPACVATLSGPDADLSITLVPSHGRTRYRARGRRMRGYERVLVIPGSIVAETDPASPAGSVRDAPSVDASLVHDASAFLADLLPDLPGTAADHARFAEELARTQANHAASLLQGAGTALAGLSYEALEGALPDGHRYHPCFKSRIGFTPRDNRAFGPEFGRPLRPVWIAVHRSLAVAGSLAEAGGQDDALLAQSLGPEILAEFRGRLDGRADEFVLLPVHPWQWRQVGEAATEAEERAGRVVVLGESPHLYGAQQSIRTLADRTAPGAPSLKLALSIRNTSTARTLAPHTVLNAPIVSGWLAEIAAENPYLRDSGVVLLAERMGVAVTALPPHDRDGTTRGALSAIWRDPLTPHLRDGEAAVPLTALTHHDRGAPFIAGWIARHGIEPWLDRLLAVAMLPVVHLLLAEGIAVESHQQNMALLHRDGWPARVALKDFHDGVRFIPDHVARRPPLTPTPPEHARVNANSYVEARDVEDVRDFMVDALFGVNFAELGYGLDLWFGYPEARFWERVVAALAGHCTAHPAARAGALRYRLAADTLVVEDLARRRLDPANASGRRRPNPLAGLGPLL
ncbi:IucA/IucC family protein [Methylobacterium aquaticum]|uniref:IucA/IucC family protein n=2 Tax=Methylobacterium aquaticum TaxID=270351 RepID=A0A0C6F5D7_9HYPH|nr:IucA/IucC family protein [Methylobacterium aquaticum]BAQ47981.1 IucA/IucC family protein [Methylobacterium aquaticum]